MPSPWEYRKVQNCWFALGIRKARTHKHTHTHTHTRVRRHVRRYRKKDTYAHIHTYRYTAQGQTHAHTQTYSYTQTQTRITVCKTSPTHACTHTHTHTRYVKHVLTNSSSNPMQRLPETGSSLLNFKTIYLRFVYFHVKMFRVMCDGCETDLSNITDQ